VVLLKAGRVAVSGSKASVLTSTHLSTIFDAPVELQAVGDYYYAQAGVPVEGA